MPLPDARGDSRPGAGDHVSPEGFQMLQRLLRREAGIELEAGKEYLVETRLAALALHEGYATVRALVDALQTEEGVGALHRQVIEALAITETSFFRDLTPFEILRKEILPELIRRRAECHALNLWSAACSNGQEPYSVAMVLRESFPQLIGWSVGLLASDLSRAAIARGTAGVYSQIEVNRGLPAPLLVKYFHREGIEWRIGDDLRRMVRFRELNLVAPWPVMPMMDVILLRNVLLYFGAEARARVLHGVSRCLSPDGYLILGGGEATLAVGDAFEPVQFGKTILYRRSRNVGSWRRTAA